MSPYGLSFAERFFSPDEPECLKPSQRPTNVYQAIASISDETWQQMAHDVFNVAPDRLDVDAVMQRIHETDSCTIRLDSPVEVWIDDDGFYTVAVYDEPTDA